MLAGCFGRGSGSTASSVNPLVVAPALGQVYSGQVSVTGSNNIARNYSIVSGVPTITADITGMTAPLLIELTGNPLVFFDEGLGRIASSVVSSASAVRAIIPSVTGLPASGVSVTPLTEIAAATVANASGVVVIGNLTAASAVGANAAGLALAQKIGNSTAFNNVLAPPTTVSNLNMSLGTTVGDLYAKVLSALATMPAYGANAFEIAKALSASVAASGVLPATFDAALTSAASNAAASAVSAGATYSALTPLAANADFKAIMNISAGALPASAVSASTQQAAQLAMVASAFNAASAPNGVSPAINLVSAVAAANTMAASAVQAMLASITPGAGVSTGNVCLANVAIAGTSLVGACYTNLPAGFNCSQAGIEGSGGTMPAAAGGATFSFNTATACPAGTLVTVDVGQLVNSVAGGTPGGTAGGGTAGGTVTPIVAATVAAGTKFGGAVMGPLALAGTVTPVALAPALTMPPLAAALTTDGVNLYVYGSTAASGSGVYKIVKASGATSLLAATTGNITALTSDGANIFVFSYGAVGGVAGATTGAVFQITPAGVVTLVVTLPGYSAFVNGMAVVGNNLYFAVAGSAFTPGEREIKKVDLTTKVVSTLTFGRNSCAGYMVCDGVGTNTVAGVGATFNWLGAMTTDGSYLYVLEAGDANPGIVRQISIADGSVKTLGGITRLLWANYASWLMGTGITTDGAGNVYVVNQATSQIIKYDIVTGAATVVATGSAAGASCATNAMMRACTGFHGGVTSDGVSLYAIDANNLVKIL